MKPAAVRRGRAAGQRAAYLLNHSDLRGFARHASDRDRTLAEVCDSRRWWFGDHWCVPAIFGAQAALRVLIERKQSDPLQRLAQVRAMLPQDQLPTFLKIRSGLHRIWTHGRAPLPGASA